MADGKTQMDEPSSKKDKSSSQTDFDVSSEGEGSRRHSDRGEDAKEEALGDKPQEDLTAEDLEGDSRSSK